MPISDCYGNRQVQSCKENRYQTDTESHHDNEISANTYTY